MAALRRLPPTQPGDDTRPLPPPQHPRPLQQAAQLQVLLLHRLGKGLPSNTDGGPGRCQNGDHHAVRFVQVPLHAFLPLQRSIDLTALHGQPIQAPPLHVLILGRHHHRQPHPRGAPRASPADLHHPSGEWPADQPSKVRVRRRRGVLGTPGGPAQAISDFPPLRM